jgi:hypothetical protein
MYCLRGSPKEITFHPFSMSDRQKLFCALVVSVLVHLAIAVVLAFWSTVNSVETALALKQASAQQADLSQLKVTIYNATPTPTPTPPFMVIVPKVLPELDSDGLTQSKTAPKNAIFQSDSNMVAGSELPAVGFVPLPSQNGDKSKFVDFSNSAASMGKGTTTANRPAPPTQAASSGPPLPEQTPNAVTKVQDRKTAQTTPQTQQTPQPPQATPAPKPAPTAPPDSFAIGTPTPKPTAQPTPIEVAKLSSPPPLRAQPDIAPMVRPGTDQPQTPPSAQPGTQRELHKMDIEGNLPRGRPGIDAVETPYGRYHRQLSQIIGSRWNAYVAEHPHDVGEVTILMAIDPSGKVKSARVVSNQSLDGLAEVSTRAILDSDLPPVPDDLAPMLRNGKLEITFQFSIYDRNEPQ